MKKEEIVGVIPVRWNSTRFPGKPLANLLGKSLIRRTYENAKHCLQLDKLIVAVDDQRIFDHVQEFGAEVYMTSPACTTGTDRVWEVIEQHCPSATIVVNIQGDEPCFAPAVIHTLIERLLHIPGSVMTTPIAKIVDPEHIFSPAAVKCVFDTHGRALYFSRAPIPFPQNTKTLHDYYRHLGVYCFRRQFLEHYAKMAATRLQEIEDLEQLKILETGHPIHIALVDDQGIGVDTPEDLRKVEEMLCANTSL